MNRWLLAIMLILMVFLAGCQGAQNAAPRVIQAAKPAAGAADDLAKLGQSVIRSHGDELAANANKIRLNPGFQKVDDLSETVTGFKGDILSTRKVGESAEDVARAQLDIYNAIITNVPETGVSAPRVIYNTPLDEWASHQVGAYEKIRSALNLSKEDAQLFVAASCQVFEFVERYAENPSQDYVVVSIMLEQLSKQRDPPQMEYIEFADKVLRYARAAMDAQGEANGQEAAKILFNGLCLVAE